MLRVRTYKRARTHKSERKLESALNHHGIECCRDAAEAPGRVRLEFRFNTTALVHGACFVAKRARTSQRASVSSGTLTNSHRLFPIIRHASMLRGGAGAVQNTGTRLGLCCS